MPIDEATRLASWRSSSEQQLPNEGLALALVVQLHRQADDLMALLGEQRSGHRRIDAAGHRATISWREQSSSLRESRRAHRRHQ